MSHSNGKTKGAGQTTAVVAVACYFLSLVGVPLAGAAPAAEIVLIAAGEAYQGPPEFRVLANGKVLGTARVTQAIDTSGGEGLPLEGEQLKQHAQRFVFPVAQDIRDIESIEIEFVNDAWAGEGKPGDRNLYFLSLSVRTDGLSSSYGPMSFTPIGKEGNPLLTESYAVFYSGGKLRLNRPAGGWVESAERMTPGQATQLNCAEARRMLRLRYRQVRTVECSGRVYTFRAVTKAGQRIRVKVNAPKGTWWVM
jgi:hypothetical protein